MKYEFKGRLKLCPEGERLLREYEKEVILLEKHKSDVHVRSTKELWKAYLRHREECDDCTYI